MKRESRFQIKFLIRYAMLAYIIMSIVYLFLFDKDLLYFNIKLVELSEFWIQLAIVGFLAIVFLAAHRLMLYIGLKSLLGFFFMLYLFFFAYLSPALSLVYGSVLMAIPLMVYSLFNLKHDEKRLISTIIYMGQLLLFVGLIAILIFNLTYDYPFIDGVNLSNISHDKIFDESQFLILMIGGLITFSTLFFTSQINIKLKKYFSVFILVLVIGLVVFEVYSLAITMVYRTKILQSPAYDFGIFTQMFYNMKNGHGMVTTLERGYVLSHMAVHVSPIYYLLLPVFMIFPEPETLQIAQAIIVGLGVIPIMLIGKHLKLSIIPIMIVVAMYIFHPAIISSSYFDLHENCFLPPLILFVVYFGLKLNIIGVSIFSILTLMVKEDAFIYLVFIGLFLLFSDVVATHTKKQELKKYVMFSVLIVVSISYFLVITHFLNELGDGAMFWRFDNLNGYEEYKLLGIAMSLFQSPSYWLATLFSPNKILNLLIIFLTLGFIPLRVHKLNVYWLIIPILLMNFSSTYQYQHQIGFQYYYGTTSLLIVMVLLWFYQKKDEPIQKDDFPRYGFLKQFFFVVITLLFVISSGLLTLDKKSYYQEYYHNNTELYESMKETLQSIPSDKKVLATTWLTPYLSNRMHLYHYNYHNFSESDLLFDYIMIDRRFMSQQDQLSAINRFSLLGYSYSALTTEYIIILIPDDSIE